MNIRAIQRGLAAVAALLIVLASGRAAFADTVTLQWDSNREPGVAGYVVHVGTHSRTYTQTYDVGRTTIWSFTTATRGQTYCFAVSAYFTGSDHGPLSNEVCAQGVAAPAVANPGPQSSARGAPVALQIVASDPGGHPVTYRGTSLPPGISLMESTGFISGTPTTTGTYDVIVEVSNGTDETAVSFTWTVVATSNTPPVMTSVPNQVTQAMLATTLQLVATDAEGDRLTFSASGLPPGLTVNPDTGLISGTATTAGVYSVTATVSDSRSAAARTFTWTVTGAGDRTAPSITITSPTASATYLWAGPSVTLRGTAGDNVAVTQVSWADSRGGRGTASGTTNWRATIPLQTGTTLITVTARDAAGNTASDTLTVSPPLFVTLTTSRPAPQRAGTRITFTAMAHGSVAPYQFRWQVFDGTRWTVVRAWSSSNGYTWTPPTASPLYQIEVSVRGASGDQAFTRMPFAIQ